MFEHGRPGERIGERIRAIARGWHPMLTDYRLPYRDDHHRRLYALGTHHRLHRSSQCLQVEEGKWGCHILKFVIRWCGGRKWFPRLCRLRDICLWRFLARVWATDGGFAIIACLARHELRLVSICSFPESYASY